jgi:Cdc6-like AAA superfamily ATPase
LKVEQDEEHQATKQYQSVLSSLKIDETEQIAIFESICEEGSEFAVKCDWMTRNKQISAWLQRKPETRQLWIQGNPGTGKSVISKQLVTYIQASKSQVLHHFCSYTYASSMRYDAILKSLLHQLLRASGELSAYVYQEYVVSKKVPTTTSLEQIFETLLASLSLSRQPEYIWLIIDGIEECEKAKQTRLISFLFNIASKHDTRGSTYCKVLLSSRALPTRIKRLPMKQIVSLGDEMEHVSKAIRLYASHRLLPLHERLRQLDLGAEEVESIVTQKAAGE